MCRVVFVGLHNKPNKTALCSSTRSGKTIDRIIEDLGEYECIKTNLYDVGWLPDGVNRFAYREAWRVNNGITDSDIIVGLGSKVKEGLEATSFDFIHVYHPAARKISSNQLKEEYILETIDKIKNYKPAEVSA